MPQKTRQNYMPYIDGLRGISVLTILLFHLDISYFGGGFIGVDIFFVISGFLITQIITREIKAGQFSFARFYARRIKRIFPALFAMLFFTSLGAVIFLGAQEYSDFFKTLRMTSGQISNIFFSRELDYFARGNDNSPLLHTWSLGVEEQFYLLWPLLLMFVHRFLGLQRGLLVLGGLLIVSLGVSEYLVRTSALDAFYLLHARAWELSMGGIVALYVLPTLKQQHWINALSMTGLSLIIACAVLYKEGNFPGIKAALPCLGASLLIYTAQQGQGIAHKILSTRVLVFTGLISYSLYLWHWPIIAFYKSYFGSDLDLMTRIVMAMAAFGLAYLSYRLVEQPFRHSQASPRRTIALGIATIVLFIVTSNVVKNENQASWRINYKLEKAETRPNEYFPRCAVNGGAANKEACIIGPNKNNYEVILVGDSFAAHYAPTVLEWAKGKGLTVRLFMRGGCQTWGERTDEVLKDGKKDVECVELSRDFYKTLEEDRHIQYVFLALITPNVNDDIRHALKKIDSYKKKTYFLGTTPLFKEDPHNCQIKNNLLISKWFPREQVKCFEWDHDYSDPLLAASRSGMDPVLKDLGIPYFDPVPYIEKPFDRQGRFLFMDTGHLNIYGGLYLAPYLTTFIQQNP